MQNNRITAYTLMEITIAMLLSAICMVICYSAYDLISAYYRNFRDKNEANDAVFGLKHAMIHDLSKGKYLIRTAQGFEVLNKDTTITYQFNEEYILRDLGEQHTDTFFLKTTNLQFHFEQKEVSEMDTVDQVDFSVQLDSNTRVPMRMTKRYSAQDLFR
ncbi:hypothetical protein ACJVDH_05935 [Pedobacter sp. AW1-32]|uniref:hypothetical protein n=1 Tax=Pedobacter sp. AW1-32 TaxID=3383026 RepID=UPI003FEF0862